MRYSKLKTKLSLVFESVKLRVAVASLTKHNTIKIYIFGEIENAVEIFTPFFFSKVMKCIGFGKCLEKTGLHLQLLHNLQ